LDVRHRRRGVRGLHGELDAVAHGTGGARGTRCGLDFGDPTQIRVVPQPSQGGGFLKNWFGKQQTDIGEHPASENIAGEIQKQLAQDPSLVHVRDDNGWTFLHHEALAGSLAPIKVLLAAGADPRAVTNHGLTPLQLARSLGWENVVALLTARN